MKPIPSPDVRHRFGGSTTGGMFVLRVRCLGSPAVLRTRTEVVRGFTDIGRNGIVLLLERRPWPIGGERRIRYAMRVASSRVVANRTGVQHLELEAASVWPLERPFHLSEALEDTSAYGAPVPILRLSNLHEERIRRSGLLDRLLPPCDPLEMDAEVRALFLTLWSKATDGPDYDKGQWSALRGMLADRGIRT